MLSAKRNGEAAKRFFKKMLKDTALLAPDRVGIDGDRAFSGAIVVSVNEGLLPKGLTHYVTKHLQQGIESDHFQVKKPMARSGGFQSFNTARRTIKGSEAMLWLRKGFGLTEDWTINEQSNLVSLCFGLRRVNKA